MLNRIMVIMGIIGLFLIISCRQSLEGYSEKTYSVEIIEIDPAVTEAWITIRVEGTENSVAVELYQMDTLLFAGNLSKGDTIIYDNTLKPNTQYEYFLKYYKTPNLKLEGNQVAVNTYDTTNVPNYTWKEIFFPSPFGNGTFNDIHVINENDYWLVGAVPNDTSEWQKPFNAVHYLNGEWHYYKVPYKSSNSDYMYVTELSSLFYESPDKIWFGYGNLVFYNGESYRNVDLPNFVSRALKIVESKNGLTYVLGVDGHIAYSSDRFNWTVKKFEDDKVFTAIFDYDNETYAALGNLGTTVFRHMDNEFIPIRLDSETPQALIRDAVNFKKNKFILAAAGIQYGCFNSKNHLIMNRINDAITSSPISIKIEKKGINQIFVGGMDGDVYYFNGVKWQRIRDKNPVFFIYDMAVKDGIIYLVGEKPDIGIRWQPILIIGRPT